MHLRKPIARTLAAGLGLALAGAAVAETSPYYIGVNQAFGYQTNLYSQTSATIRGIPPPDPLSSATSSTSLIFGIDQPFGRQHFFASGNVAYNYFFNSDPNVQVLNNTSYGVNLGLDWQTVERLSGTVRAAANQSLVYYSIGGALPSVGNQNIQNLAQLDLTVRYGITPRIAIVGGYDYSNVRFSADSYSSQEYSQNVGSLGLQYGVSGVLNLGAGLRFTRTDYPNYFLPFAPIGNTADGRNIDLTATWVPSGLSSLDARLSFTNIDYQINTGNNFRGVNGALGWNWQPTGKIQTRLSFVSTPGSGINNLQVNNSKFARTVNLSATYLATGKTSFNANIGVTQDQFSRPPVPLLPESANDLYTTVGLGVNYTPTRNSKLACNLGYQRRSAGDAAITFGYYPYHGANFSCSGQLVLQ